MVQAVPMEALTVKANHLTTNNLGQSSLSPEPSYLPVPHPTKSFWEVEPDPLHNHRTTASLPPQTDVLIIGAGYAGASTAYHLTKHFQSFPSQELNTITILEARSACSGATGRNGGHLRPDLYGHIPTYVDRAGAEAAEEIARFEIAHVKVIKKVVEEEGIDCDFTLCRSYDVWCDEEAASKAKKTIESMRKSGFGYMDDVIFYEGDRAEGMCGVKGAKACASYTAGTMWPYKFILQILRAALDSGSVNLQTNTPAKSIIPDAHGGWVVSTPRGTIHAKRVIHASNGYVSGLLPEYSSNIVPCKGICCRIAVPLGATAPLLNDSYINRTTDGVLSYLVPRADGSIVVGGASSTFKPFRGQWYRNTDDSVLIDAAEKYYDDYMQRTYRGWEESGASVQSIWTGVMGYSYDSNPHIGEVPGKAGQMILAGFNGHGMPVIWLAAKELLRMVVDGVMFEETGLPRLFKTTLARIDRARTGREEDGDILGTGSFPATKQ